MLLLPEKYESKLMLRETQKAIKEVKDIFQISLSKKLKLDRITTPLFVTSESGINDDLNGVERKVSFTTKETGKELQVVQSLAKWKRMALYKYKYPVGEGIYTDMNAIRCDDLMDNLHSIFVDQWDWEAVISRENRTLDYLKSIVIDIVDTVVSAKEKLNSLYPQLQYSLKREVFFITSQELEDLYPNLSSKDREYEIVKEHKTVFIMQIGKKLNSGEKHDGRSPDYDDWDLNGDILFWNETLQIPIEISSMGIRVDENSLLNQLEISNAQERLKYDYHKMILNNTLPLTIGGGIGQSRLCLLILEKAHIGEVQVSVWPEEMVSLCEKHNIFLL